MTSGPVPTVPTAAPDSKPKEGGIPDIMRGIGNMLRIAILEYNYKASRNELTKVVKEIRGLKSDNAKLVADVTLLTRNLQNATQQWRNNYDALQNANTGFRQHLQDLQDANVGLDRELQQARQNIEDLEHENQGLRAVLDELQQQLGLAQQQTQQQIQQIQQARAAEDDARNTAYNANNNADAAIELAQQAQQRAQEAEKHAREAETARSAAAQDVTRLEAQIAQLQNQEGVSAGQVQVLQTALATAEANARAAADREQRANQARDDAQTAARAAADEVQTANQARAAAEADVAAANQAREAAQQERDTALGRIGHAEEQARLATIRAAESAVQVRNLQTQLAQQGLSQQQVATLNQQLQDAVQKADADKAAAEETNRTLEQQLDQQMQDAQAAAQKAANEQQELAAKLEALQGQVDTTEKGNTELQAQIEDIQRDLEQAKATARNTQQYADEAQQQFQTQLEQVQATATAKVAQAQRRVEDLETQLEQAKENGTNTEVQLAELEKQLEEQQAAVEKAQRAQQEAERASEDTKKQITQQKVANTIMSAIKSKANTAADEAARARQEANQARTAAAEQVAAANAEAESAKAAIKEAAAQQQSQLAALQQQLQIAKSKGQEVDTLNQQLAAKERELEAQKLAQAAEVKAAEEKAEAAKAEAAQQVAAAEAAKKAAEAAEAERIHAQAEANAARDDAARAAGELRREREAFEKTQRERDTALNILKKQLTERLKSVQTKITSPPLTQEQQEGFMKTANEVQTVITGMQNAEESQITNLSVRITELEQQLEQATRQRQEEDERKQADKKKLADEQNAKTAEVKKRLNDNLDKLQIEINKTPKDRQTILNKQVSLVKKSIDALNFENMNVEEPKIRNAIQEIMESTGTKIRTFIVMKGRGKEKEPTDGGFIFNDADKTVTQDSKQWGPFSDVFDASKTNQDKYNSIKPVIESLPQGKTLVIFGYGYSGSGKTYTLLGEREPEVHGVTQLAIQDYITAKKKVVLEEAFGMYNDTYNPLKLEKTHVAYNDTEKTVFNKNLAITSVKQFNDICSTIESKRKEFGHIKPTQNNPKSSRGHLFIHLTVSDSGSIGNLIICDMGGRENPNEMWKTGKYCLEKSGGGGIKIAHPIVRGKSSYYYDAGGNEKKCSGTVHTTSQAVTGNNVNLALGLTNNTSITKIIKQGFYINDSINELLDFFKYDFSNKTGTGWSGKLDKSDTVYDPDVKVTVDKTSDVIGIKKLFDEFEKLTPGKIKYFTFACIRPSKEFLEDSKNTMEFATKVNSCPAAKFDKLLGLAKKGGSIRRQRRKKHAIFKTFKKDSALASDSNSVKVKHKTRNKKKHNTRNNTVKK